VRATCYILCAISVAISGTYRRRYTGNEREEFEMERSTWTARKSLSMKSGAMGSLCEPCQCTESSNAIQTCLVDDLDEVICRVACGICASMSNVVKCFVGGCVRLQKAEICGRRKKGRRSVVQASFMGPLWCTSESGQLVRDFSTLIDYLHALRSKSQYLSISSWTTEPPLPCNKPFTNSEQNNAPKHWSCIVHRHPSQRQACR
jgi:hypothetical protein